MSYQVIARKWRPQSFDDVTGQSHVTTPLRNAIRSDRMPHAVLLTGPRGVGKTTLARILARCLNCEKGPTDTPCGTCVGCQEIISGRSTDVQEIDAASRTGIDDIREIIDSIRYAPSPGKHRIFIVDEVHMLSKPAFNALLKTLEEPPPSSLFVFATTNPEAIPFTVLSRCQRYDLRRIAAPEVARCLGSIAEAEGIQISGQSLLALAREGDGSMRDSQTLLDQVISYGGTSVDDETVSQVLDLIDRRVLVAIAKACVESNPRAALEACAVAMDKGTDPKRLGASLIGLVRDLVVLSISPDAADELVEGSAEDIAELGALAQTSNTARLRRMFRVLVSEQEDLAWAPQPFAVLEMAVVRIASLPEAGDIAQLIARLDALEKTLAGGGGSGPPPGRGGGGAPGASIPGALPDSNKRAAVVETASDDHASGEPATLPSAEAIATPGAVLDRLRDMAKKQNLPLCRSLDAVELVERSATHLHFAADGDFFAKRLEDRREDLEALCQRFFGKPMTVVISQAESNSKARSQNKRAIANQEQDRERRQAALNHPSINLVLKELRAEIIDIRALEAPKGRQA